SGKGIQDEQGREEEFNRLALPRRLTPRNEKQCVSLVRAVIPSLPHSSQCREGDPVATKDVFSLMKIAPGAATGFGGHPKLYPKMPPDAFIAALRKGRNDMEAAACLLAPVIGDVLAVLSAAPGCRLARMSGSGATCFALFKDCRSAARAKKAILRAWAKTCVLN
ncbi:MAG: hypothetical protein WA231_16010, partial [Methylocella sp.]